MSTERWLRVNTCWSDSEWLYEQSVGVRLAWIELLCYVKRDGVRGRAKAMSISVASNKWRIPKEDIVTLLSVSVTDEALQIADNDWIILNWSKYQGESNERVQRFREKERSKEKETLTETLTLTGDVTPVTPVTLRNVTSKESSNELSLVSSKPTRRRRTAADFTDKFWEFWNRYPKPGRLRSGPDKSFFEWKRLGLEDKFDEVMESLNAWRTSKQWTNPTSDGRSPVVGVDRWLREGRWRKEAI